MALLPQPLLDAGIALAIAVIEEEEEEEARKERRGARRRVWSRDWLLKRETKSQYRTLVMELALEDPASYQNWMRVTRTQFN